MSQVQSSSVAITSAAAAATCGFLMPTHQHRPSARTGFRLLLIIATTCLITLCHSNTATATPLTDHNHHHRDGLQSSTTPDALEDVDSHLHQLHNHHHHHHHHHHGGGGAAGGATTVVLPVHHLNKRSFFDIQCKGVYDKSIFARLDRICEDCYNLFREPQLHSLCRKNCFTTDYFKGCLEALQLTDEMEQVQTWIKQLHGAEPGV